MGPTALDTYRGLLRSGDSYLMMSALWGIQDLARKAARAVPEVTRALDDSSPINRRMACRVLKTLGPDAREAVPAIERLMEDPDPEVRKAAVEALTAIATDPPPPA